jgi:hypothetical protein
MDKAVIRALLADGFHDEFPNSECTIPDPGEPGVFEAPMPYWCAVIDERFNYDIRLMLMRPYVFRKKGTKDLDGWQAYGSTLIFYHGEDASHEERVVFWKKAQEHEFLD